MHRAISLGTDGEATSESPKSGPTLVPGRVPRFLGDYELLEEVARGGMGVVYRARQGSLDRLVALKMIRDPAIATYSELRRFRAEAEAVAQLDHPNIVPIYEVGQTDDSALFQHEADRGGQPGRHVARAEGQPAQPPPRVMAKVARAVHYAHQRAILHRDLKPSNILLDDHGEPYVTDFGLAKRIEPGEAAPRQTLTGAVDGDAGLHAARAGAGRDQVADDRGRRLQPGRDALRDADGPAAVPGRLGAARSSARSSNRSRRGRGRSIPSSTATWRRSA